MDTPILFCILFNVFVFLLMLTLDLGAVCKMLNHNHATEEPVAISFSSVYKNPNFI